MIDEAKLLEKLDAAEADAKQRLTDCKELGWHGDAKVSEGIIYGIGKARIAIKELTKVGNDASNS